LRAHIGDLQFAHHQPQLLDRAGSTGATVTYESGGLVVPFAIQKSSAFFSAPEVP